MSRLGQRLNRQLAQARWKVYWYVAHFVEGDGEWGSARLFAALAGIVLFVVFGRFTEAVAPREWVTQIGGTSPLLGNLLGFVDTLITREALRHALLPTAGFLLAIYVGAAFINDLFELGSIRVAYDYLVATLFGQAYPRLALRDGKPLEADAKNPIVAIGGPGFVNVSVGLAAVFQHVAALSSVVGPGWHFVRRFETLREVFDLRDQFRAMPEIKAMTKDGIAVAVKDAQMSFRMRTGSQRRTEKEPYPYSVSALRRAALNKTVGPNGPSAWADSVAGAVAGQIRGMIARRRLDDLIAGEADAREEMRAELASPKTRARFAEMGAEVLWVSLGHFESPSQVANQRIATWQSAWQRQITITDAEAAAAQVRLEEQARGEALLDAYTQRLKTKSASQGVALDLLYSRLADVLEGATKRSDVSRQVRSDLSILILRLRLLAGVAPGDSTLDSQDILRAR